MTFTPVIDELNGARNAGYIFDESADTVTDEALYKKLRNERGGNWASDQVDALYDFDGPFYLGGDGEHYAVQMVWADDGYVPLAWHRLTKKEVGSAP